jgi:hypothetical protein
MDDTSTDDLLEVLSKYQDLGIVEYQDMSKELLAGRALGQMHWLNACYRRVLRMKAEDREADGFRPRWILFPDADEFFHSRVANLTLIQALDNIPQLDESTCIKVRGGDATVSAEGGCPR